jgi:hypothetical protein
MSLAAAAAAAADDDDDDNAAAAIADKQLIDSHTNAYAIHFVLGSQFPVSCL